MLINMACFACPPSSSPSAVYKVPSTTEYWTLALCPKGHQVIIRFNTPGWGRLFDRALARLAAGMPRDAALDAYTAFEMYLAEVPIRARYDREVDASPQRLREQMKDAVGRAEWAIGAARCAASIVTGLPAIKWSEDATVKIRNLAAHRGYYPTENEATKLCEVVATTIRSFHDALERVTCVNATPYHMKIWIEAMAEATKTHPDVKVCECCVPDIFDWSYTQDARPTVKDRLAEYRKDMKPGDVL